MENSISVDEHLINMDRREVSPIPRENRAESMMDVESSANQAAQEEGGCLCTLVVDKALPEADAKAEVGKVLAAVESLVPLEQQTRLGADEESNARLVKHMVKICFEGAAWPLLNDTIVALSKQRSIIELSMTRMVRYCSWMIDHLPDEESKVKLTETLRQVTVGKIYLEEERTQLTGRLVKKLKLEGNVEAAFSMLLEVPVETFGSMEVGEKVEFLLEQLRFCVLREDFILGTIISKEIPVRFFDDTAQSVQELKLKYYDLMVKLALHDNAYLDVCRYYGQIYDTPRVQADAEKSKQVLKCMTLYVLLAPYNIEQWALLNNIAGMQQIESIPDYKSLLEMFINQQIISWKETVLTHYEPWLRLGTPENVATDVFVDNPEGNTRWIGLRTRVAENNLRWIYENKPEHTLKEMDELLEFSEEEREHFLCHLSVHALYDAKRQPPSRATDMNTRHQVETLMIKEKMFRQQVQDEEKMARKERDDSDIQ